MAKGEVFAPEWHEVEDLETGVKSRQLTDHKAHSHHLYFTNSGWYDDNQRSCSARTVAGPATSTASTCAAVSSVSSPTSRSRGERDPARSSRRR